MTKRYLKTPEEVMQALKEGKPVETDMKYYVLKDGLLNCYAKNKTGSWWSINSAIYDTDRPYILEEEPFKIEVGKWYETRDHQKARCFKINPGLCFFTIDNVGNFNTLTNGNYYINGKTSNLDIIDTWGNK